MTAIYRYEYVSGSFYHCEKVPLILELYQYPIIVLKCKMIESNSNEFLGCSSFEYNHFALHGRHVRTQVPHSRTEQHFSYVAAFGYSKSQLRPI